MTVEDKTAEVIDGGAAGGDDAGDKGAKAAGDAGDKSATSDGDAKVSDTTVENILEDFGLDSPDELKEWLKNFQDLKGKIGDEDFDEIVENHKALKAYQKKWAADERTKLKEKETPEETIARLERENQDLQNKRQTEKEARSQAQAAKRAVEGFNNTVTGLIEGEKTVPKSWRPYIAEFMGVNNPINEVDLDDKAAVRRLTKEGIKKMSTFAQLIIKEYRDGKVEIPKVGGAEPPPSQATKPKGVKNLSEARRIMHESLGAILGKK